MTPEQTELLRNRLLMTARKLTKQTGSLDIFHLAAKQSGFDLTPADVEAHLVYLADKSLLAPSKSGISGGLDRWRLTATGTDYLDSQNL